MAPGRGKEKQLTIDELARKTGMTVRNIRAHQSRGLLAPPQVKGRTGFYSDEHIARIELIKELQGDGYSLELIKRLVDDNAGASAEVLRLTRVVREPFATEEPQVVTLEELAERFQTADLELVERAERLGLIRPLGEGRYEEVSPTLVRAGVEIVALGIPMEKALDVVERLRKASDQAAKTFTRLFIDEIWKPAAVSSDNPDEVLAEISDTIERLRPHASEALLAVFGMAMDEEVEKAFGREVMRRGDRSRGNSGSKPRRGSRRRSSGNG